MARRSKRESMVGWIVSVEDENGITHTCDLCDVAADGLFVSPQSSSHGFNPGQRVRVLIRTGGVQLHVGGEVRWVGASETHEATGFGVKLDNIP